MHPVEHPEYERLWQFLRRALLSNARISTTQDLAAYLASYAREARASFFARYDMGDAVDSSTAPRDSQKVCSKSKRFSAIEVVA